MLTVAPAGSNDSLQGLLKERSNANSSNVRWARSCLQTEPLARSEAALRHYACHHLTNPGMLTTQTCCLHLSNVRQGSCCLLRPADTAALSWSSEILDQRPVIQFKMSVSAIVAHMGTPWCPPLVFQEALVHYPAQAEHGCTRHMVLRLALHSYLLHCFHSTAEHVGHALIADNISSSLSARRASWMLASSRIFLQLVHVQHDLRVGNVLQKGVCRRALNMSNVPCAGAMLRAVCPVP